MCLLKRLFLAGITCNFLLLANAQEAEVELNPVTVTSSLNPINASKTGRNILVIGQSLLKNLPVHSIDELLKYMPGLEVQSRGPMGTQSDFVLRGGTFQQVLVILDGIRLNDPLTGHFNSYIPVVPAEIERIEILKGASSAIYGTEAVGGVINIITKTFALKKTGQVLKSGQAQVTAGEYNLLNAQAGGLFSNGQTAIAGGVSTNNSDGQLQRGTRGFFHLHTGSLSASHWLSDNWKLSFRTAYDDRKFSAQNFYTADPGDTATEQVSSFWNQLQLSYEKTKDHFSVSAGYKTIEDFYVYNKNISPNDNHSKLVQAVAVYERNLTQRTSVATGVQFQNRSITSNDRGDHSIAQAAFFALLDAQLNEHLRVNPALRVDWNQRGGTELVPQLNLSYTTGSLQLRGSAGKTIREADFTERFNNYNKPIVSRGRIGNPDLTAERSVSYELGADYFVASAAKFSVTFFQRDHRDMIDYVRTSYNDMPRKDNLVAGNFYDLAKNIYSVATKGLEADIQYRMNISDHSSLLTTFGLTWLDTKSTEPNPSFYILSHAKLLSNFSVMINSPRYTFGLTALYKLRDPQAAPAIKAEVARDYFVLNAKASYMVIKNKVGLFVQVDNVLDHTYADLLGAPMPQRWLQGGVRVTL